jgi:hypothetical protein
MLMQQNEELTTCVHTLEDAITELKGIVSIGVFVSTSDNGQLNFIILKLYKDYIGSLFLST